MNLILRVAAAEAKAAAEDEATWEDAQAVLRDAAKDMGVTYAEKGGKVILTNKKTKDYGEVTYSGGKVHFELFEEDEDKPYSKGTVTLRSFKDRDDWKEKLVMTVEGIAI